MQCVHTVKSLEKCQSQVFPRFFQCFSLNSWWFLLYLASDIHKIWISFSSTLIFIKRSKTSFSRWDNAVLGMFTVWELKAINTGSLLFVLCQIDILWSNKELQWCTITLFLSRIRGCQIGFHKHCICTVKAWKSVNGHIFQ